MAENAAITWQEQWDRDVEAFLNRRDGTVPDSLAELLVKCAQLVPTTLQNVFCVPGIVFEGTPPSFPEILEMARAGEEVPIQGITEGQVRVLAGG